MKKTLPVVWLTGNTGAGKTTLAFGVQRELQGDHAPAHLRNRVVVLDGDEMRASISTEEGLSPEDRKRHNLRVARLAEVLARQGLLVIVAVIAPFAPVRQEIDSICQPRWVYVKRSGLEASDKPYEPPIRPHLLVDNDELSIEDARTSFLKYLQRL